MAEAYRPNQINQSLIDVIQQVGFRFAFYMVWSAIPCLLVYKMLGWTAFFLFAALMQTRRVTIGAIRGGPKVYYFVQAMRLWCKLGYLWIIYQLVTIYLSGPVMPGSGKSYYCPAQSFSCVKRLAPPPSHGDYLNWGGYHMVFNGYRWELILS